MKRRQLILLLGGGSAAAASVGTGAFSSVSADREVSVNVVEDEAAYLGITVDDEDDAVRIENQFTADLDLTATLESAEPGVNEVAVDGPITFVDRTGSDDGIEIDDESDGGTLGSGESARVGVKFDEAEEFSFTLSFEGEAGGASVDKTREFTLRPEDVTEHVTKVKFFGDSEKVRILTTENNGGGGGVDGVVSAKLHCENDGAVTSSDGFENVPVNADLYIGDFDDDDLDGSIAGIEINRIDGVFEKPENSGGGDGNTVSRDETESDPFDG